MKLSFSNRAKQIRDLYGIFIVRGLIQKEDAAKRVSLSKEEADGYIIWEQPNRANTPELQIGRSGGRYSTLTGVWWLDSRRYIVAHRSGLKIAVFSTDDMNCPQWTADIDHLSDDIAAKRLNSKKWEISISGCWSCIYSRYELSFETSFEIEKLEVVKSKTSDFCHGVAYDTNGQLCHSIHTGVDPRVTIADKVYRLRAPWGVRDLCHDPYRKRYVAIAVSSNPRRRVYNGVKSSIWTCDEVGSKWSCLAVYDGVHSDAIDIWGEHIWIPDQLGDRLLALKAETGEIDYIVSGDCIDFPHGIGISSQGTIAVTNYGSSSVLLVNADSLLQNERLEAVKRSTN